MTTEPAAEGLGPVERKHFQYASFRAVAGGAEVTRTHWHIAVANGLGCCFDGMDSMVFSLVAPLVITEFALDLPSYRSGVQIALFVGIARTVLLAVARRPPWAA
jgi:hypothetical protein